MFTKQLIALLMVCTIAPAIVKASENEYGDYLLSHAEFLKKKYAETNGYLQDSHDFNSLVNLKSTTPLTWHNAMRGYRACSNNVALFACDGTPEEIERVQSYATQTYSGLKAIDQNHGDDTKKKTAFRQTLTEITHQAQITSLKKAKDFIEKNRKKLHPRYTALPKLATIFRLTGIVSTTCAITSFIAPSAHQQWLWNITKITGGLCGIAYGSSNLLHRKDPTLVQRYRIYTAMESIPGPFVLKRQRVHNRQQ